MVLFSIRKLTNFFNCHIRILPVHTFLVAPVRLWLYANMAGNLCCEGEGISSWDRTRERNIFASAAGPSLWDTAPSLVTNTKLNVCGDKLREGNNPCENDKCFIVFIFLTSLAS